MGQRWGKKGQVIGSELLEGCGLCRSQDPLQELRSSTRESLGGSVGEVRIEEEEEERVS